MPRPLLEKILVDHCISVRRTLPNPRAWFDYFDRGKLYALEVVSGPNGENLDQWREVSTWSVRRLRDWLGY
jgi:hypothetical protein